jgi:signal transduction histidine kinase
MALASTSAFAKDHIVERAWLEDPQGTLGWPEVQERSTRIFQGTLTKGFGESIIWLRLRIDPLAHSVPARSQDRLILRIRPVYLDDIRVYDPLVPGGLAGVTGDTHHPRQDEFHGLDFLIPVAKGSQPRDIWLRMASTSTRQIDVQALSIDDLNIRAHTQSLVFSGYVGLVAILTIWGIVYWFFSREAVIGAFGIMQTGALFFALSSLGHLRAVWPPEWPAWVLHEATTVFSLTAVTSAEWFHVKLTGEFDLPPWIRSLHRTIIGLLPIKFLLLMMGMTTAALRLNMSEVLIAPVVFMVSVVLARGWGRGLEHRPPLSHEVMVGFYFLLLVVVMGAALPALGVSQSSEVALYIVQLHGLVTAFLVLLMLQYRANVLNRQQRETRLALERSLLQTQQERTVREEQEKLLAMLAHELKTPLATMHMRLDSSAPGSREIKQAIRDMNNVIDRCQQTLQLSDRQLVPHIESVDMVGIVANAVSACQQPERIQLDLPEQMWVQADSQLCFIVLNNLIENACKYAASNTPILIRSNSSNLGTTNDLIKLEVINQPGQASWPDADKVFDKYYRSPHARRQAGTGLGLFLVRNLVEVMQGRIQYTPTETFIRFELYLPGSEQKNHLDRFGRPASVFL